MRYVLDELQKSLKYRLRQLEENLHKVRVYEESIEDLKKRNEEHKAAITEIKEHVETIKG